MLMLSLHAWFLITNLSCWQCSGIGSDSNGFDNYVKFADFKSEKNFRCSVDGLGRAAVGMIGRS